MGALFSALTFNAFWYPVLSCNQPGLLTPRELLLLPVAVNCFTALGACDEVVEKLDLLRSRVSAVLSGQSLSVYTILPFILHLLSWAILLCENSRTINRHMMLALPMLPSLSFDAISISNQHRVFRIDQVNIAGFDHQVKSILFN